MVRPVPVSVVQPDGRLSKVSAVAVTAVIRTQVFNAEVTNLCPPPCRRS
jgi:hypothetical protein